MPIGMPIGRGRDVYRAAYWERGLDAYRGAHRDAYKKKEGRL